MEIYVHRLTIAAAISALAVLVFAQSTSKKILIAHRGASAYAPEHTVEAYRLAIEQGADFVEQDLQVTKDSELVCLHDLTLERTTDVKEVFPDRFRADVSEDRPPGGRPVNHWYVSDFTLNEIKRLDAGSWFNAKFKGARVQTFQRRSIWSAARPGCTRRPRRPKSTANAASIWKNW
ncbi:MAG: hypothetical protein J2P21_19320 [Chloracidobacterium sp.]|nr:hypothetical protein [Chloracidobacterium sp.]